MKYLESVHKMASELEIKANAFDPEKPEIY